MTAEYALAETARRLAAGHAGQRADPRRLRDLDGLTLATGHYRNGVLLTPVTADVIAELVTDRRRSTRSLRRSRSTRVRRPLPAAPGRSSR